MIINWQAPEFEERPKGVSWYWLSIIIAAIILGISIWQKNFLFGFFVVIAEMLVITWGNREPGMVAFSLDDKGLSVGQHKKYSYAELDKFSVEESESEWKNIFLHFKSRFKPSLKIKAPASKIEEIKANLSSIVPEADHQPSLMDSIEEFIGF